MKAQYAWIVAAMLIVGTAAHTAEQPAGQARKSIRVTRLYTGNDGQTHAEQTEAALTLSPRFPLHEVTETIPSTGFQVQRWKAGSVANAHTTPQPQYVLGLSGRGEIEVAGQTVRMEAGDVVRAEDMTGKGHITRCTGPEDCITVHVFLQAK